MTTISLPFMFIGETISTLLASGNEMDFELVLLIAICKTVLSPIFGVYSISVGLALLPLGLLLYAYIWYKRSKNLDDYVSHKQ